ncbi:hypothetical protein [Phycisphaera mikurensis]|uniref:Aminoglycoside phosphotransferase domain-containing protein n=1 Tax=Phycisphaera mikurensis (strain NBRC 102666 / KCTC 22515 / FYK2301M01) TaxID=1142394 RepID=I0IC08_PHYMF|nr:hypothetical protein [Phycisphaera mikurensis]MBB6441980.1 hypothetical protein [Phycisphaera mikurensis]BAM02796.1 hypothetical protein PSMK_06370 [Phycisphaera mikurensis NBRC 102666]
MQLPPPPRDGQVLKRDGRSTVWRSGDEVFKRYEHPRWKQALTRRLGVHPAQKEVQWAEKLATAGVPTVPVIASGVDEQGRSWVATPHAGPSLHDAVAAGRLDDPATRHRVTRQAGVLTGKILYQRIRNRDHKASNLVLGAGLDEVRILDTPGFRGARGIPLVMMSLPMLLTLLRTLNAAASQAPDPAAAGITRSDRMRFYRAMLTCWPRLPDGAQRLPRHPDLVATRSPAA